MQGLRNRNILLAKDDVGKAKQLAVKLPPQGFVYGKSESRDEANVALLTSNWQAPTRSKRMQEIQPRCGLVGRDSEEYAARPAGAADRPRAAGRARGACGGGVSARCSRGPRLLDSPPLVPPRGAPIVHAGRLGTVRANYCMYSHSLRHVSASDGPIRHPKRHRSTHAGLRDSLAAHRPPTRRSTSTQALARASPSGRSCASRSRRP